MKLAEKKRSLKLLEKLRYLNNKNLFNYQVAFQHEKRLALRALYARLYEQKLKFRERIELNIIQVKKEISPILNPELFSFLEKKEFNKHNTHLKLKCKCSFAHMYERELKNLEKYSKYLSKTNHGCIREMIMEHRHEIKKNISEMNRTGLLKYAV